jgi:hypothetical protein
MGSKRMTTGTVDGPMADDKPKTLSVKLPMDVVESARVAAACRNVSMTDMLGDILRPIITKIEQEEIAKRTKATKRKE